MLRHRCILCIRNCNGIKSSLQFKHLHHQQQQSQSPQLQDRLRYPVEIKNTLNCTSALSASLDQSKQLHNHIKYRITINKRVIHTGTGTTNATNTTTVSNNITNNNNPDSNSNSGSKESSGGNNEDSKRIVKIALFGNALISSAKILCWISTGSSAMLSEAIHSLVDSGNQALLLIGLRNADNIADKTFQYGYGKSIYFWSLVSALGTFWYVK